MMNGKGPFDATGVPVASNAFYVVKVPPKFARQYGQFDNVVIPSENVDPANRVVRLGPSADKWIRTNWLYRVHLGPVLSLEREKVAGEVATAVALGSKALAAQVGKPVSTRRLRKVGVAVVAAALLLTAGAYLRGFIGASSDNSSQTLPVVQASYDGSLPPAPVLVNFTPKNSE